MCVTQSLKVATDLVLAYAHDPGLLRRPSRSEITSPVLGVLAMAALIVVAIVLAVLFV